MCLEFIFANGKTVRAKIFAVFDITNIFSESQSLLVVVKKKKLN